MQKIALQCQIARQQGKDVATYLETTHFPVKKSFPELNPRPLFFVHIPKTAGASINQFLESQFDDAEVCPAWNPQDLVTLGEKTKIFRLFRGHFPAGQIQFAPPETEIFTILREPCAQLYSMYTWLRRLDRSYWRVAEAAAKQRGNKLATSVGKDERRLAESGMKLVRTKRFLDFLKDDGPFMRMLIENMTVFLSDAGSFNHIVNRQARSRIKLISSARRNLHRCLVTGTFELLKQSLLILCWRRNWPAPTQLPKIHSFRDRQSFRAIDARSKALIAQNAREDIRLHAHAKTKMQAAWARLQEEAGLENDVVEFLNARHCERFFSVTSPVTAIDISAKCAWPGKGWGLRERNEHGQVWRWLGHAGNPTLLARLDLCNDYLITVMIHTASSMSVLDSLRASVYRQALQPISQEPQNGYTARSWALPRNAVIENEGLIEIEFSVDQPFNTNSIAFARIVIHPW